MNVGFGNERGVVEYLLQEVNKLKDNSEEVLKRDIKSWHLVLQATERVTQLS